MNRDHRIRKVMRGEFRTKLSLQDIAYHEWDGLYEVQPRLGDRTEQVLLLQKVPLTCPSFRYLFYRKVYELTDELLARCIFDLMYINEGLDKVGFKKMVEFIGAHLVQFNEMVKKPRLSYEELYPVCYKLMAQAEDDESSYRVVADKLVFFEKNTLLNTEERKKMSRESRTFMDSMFQGSFIHNKAMSLIEETSAKFSISQKQVHSLVEQRKGLKTFKSFSKHITEDTKLALADTHNEATFSSEEDFRKYKDFSDCKGKKLNTAEITKLLGISYSTCTKYNSIYKQENKV